MKVVFLIDDDSDDREIFQESLLSLETSVRYEEAGHGKEAFEKLNAEGFQKPDLIFLDLNMPVMDGREFLKNIKQDEVLKNIPVIIYSTSSSVEDKMFATKHEAAQFITKPYSIAAIREELEKAITKFLS
ncbi:response regulator [Flavobacterium sp. ACN6]|uniref:response regulator n=1 Tax=Flavobacterium sp. ACN6 TaxID=1920426 RepID=UPI000BB31D65|nr:response regulator [Flavobacterium sp. ACN6]PBJ10151.1 hypothetical protein BSF42_32200 [Flavobacterium sp. ACN6]